MRYISLFSGIEAASVAWNSLGWEPVAFSEIDRFPSAVLKHHYPAVPNLGDITKVDWSEYAGTADLLVGGSPCQAFSVAGLRKGLDDERGQLMLEYVRAVAKIRPCWVVWENVPGAFTADGGEAFATLVWALEQLGYCVSWRVLDAQFYSVAQRRQRVFVIASLGTTGSVSVLFERESLQWDSASSREKRKALTQGAAGSAEGAGGSLTPGEIQAERVYSTAGVAPTLGSSHESGGNHGPNILEPVYAVGSAAAHAEIERDLAPTSTAHFGKDAGYISTPKTLQMRSGKEGGGKGALVAEDMSATLTTGVQQTLFPGDGRVRRLTPRECERLQGFPDDWTDVPYRGKEHSPDSARYKTLGNSMAVPVMKWIGEGIDLIEKGASVGDFREA
jgi:DNA (cytosine-5)-methyltransferase 1